MLLHFIWSHAVKVCILSWKLVQVLRYNFLVLRYQTCMHMVHNLVLCSCHFIVEIPKIFGSLYNFSYSFLNHKYVPIYNFLEQGRRFCHVAGYIIIGVSIKSLCLIISQLTLFKKTLVIIFQVSTTLLNLESSIGHWVE